MSDTPIIESIRKIVLETLREEGRPVIEELVEESLDAQGPIMVASELHKQFTGKPLGTKRKALGRAPGHNHRGRCGPKCFEQNGDGDSKPGD